MGNCAAKRANKSYPSSVKVSVPDLCYLNRKSLAFLTVISQEIKHFNLKRKIKLYPDSAISWLSDGNLLIAGGSDSTSSLTRRVFLLSPSESSVRELCDLPVAVKFGHFVKYIKYIYYVGGISEAEDPYSDAGEEGAPILRYNTDDNSWEMFRNQDPGQNISKLLQRNICYEDEKARASVYSARTQTMSLKDLVNPAAFVYCERIYLVGGKIYTDGRYQIINTVISFGINIEKFEVREEKGLELPIKLHGAACSIRRNLVCVVGGYLETEMPNLDIFMLDLSDNTVKTLSAEIERPLEDHYPVFQEQKGILCFSPPKLLYVLQEKKKTYTFLIPTLTSSVSDITVISKEKEGPSKTYLVDLSLSLSVKNTAETELRTNEVRKNSSQRTSNLTAEINPRMSISSISSPRIKRIDQKDIIFESILVDDEEDIDQSNGESKIWQEDGVFCENNHRLCWSRLNSDQKITPKPLTQCSYCKNLLEDSCWECKICNFLLCNTCSDWISNSTPVKSRFLRCYSNHCFYRSKDHCEADEELIFRCCACNRNASGSKIECRKCKTLLCRGCEVIIAEFPLRPQRPRCSAGHQISWVLINSSERLESFQCSACKQEYNSIGCFKCGPCAANICICCMHSQNQSLDKADEEYSKNQYRGRVSKTPIKEIEGFGGSEISESPRKYKSKTPRQHVKNAQSRESSNSEAKIRPPVVPIDSEISEIHSVRSSPRHGGESLEVQEIFYNNLNKQNKLESEQIDDVLEVNNGEEHGREIEIEMEFDTKVEAGSRVEKSGVEYLENYQQIEESPRKNKKEKKSKRHEMKLSLQESPLHPEESEVYTEDKKSENTLLANHASPKGLHSSRVHFKKNSLKSDHSDENIEYKSPELNIKKREKSNAALKIEESAIEEPMIEDQVIEEQNSEGEIVEEFMKEASISEEQMIEEKNSERKMVEEFIIEAPMSEEQLIEESSIQEPRKRKDKKKKKKRHNKEHDEYDSNFLSQNHEEAKEETFKSSEASMICDDPQNLIAPVIEESYATEMIKALMDKFKWLKQGNNNESSSGPASEEENTEDILAFKNQPEFQNYSSHEPEIPSRNDSSSSEYALDLPDMS